MNNRLRKSEAYECVLTEETLSTKNEPDDTADFLEFESNLDD